jgi:hypothetical protein
VTKFKHYITMAACNSTLDITCACGLSPTGAAARWPFRRLSTVQTAAHPNMQCRSSSGWLERFVAEGRCILQSDAIVANMAVGLGYGQTKNRAGELCSALRFVCPDLSWNAHMLTCCRASPLA